VAPPPPGLWDGRDSPFLLERAFSGGVDPPQRGDSSPFQDPFVEETCDSSPLPRKSCVVEGVSSFDSSK